MHIKLERFPKFRGFKISPQQKWNHLTTYRIIEYTGWFKRPKAYRKWLDPTPASQFPSEAANISKSLEVSQACYKKISIASGIWFMFTKSSRKMMKTLWKQRHKWYIQRSTEYGHPELATENLLYLRFPSTDFCPKPPQRRWVDLMPKFQKSPSI